MDVAESRREDRGPRVSTKSSLVMENEWTDARRDGVTCFARPIFQARIMWIGKHYFRSSADHEKDVTALPSSAQSAESGGLTSFVLWRIPQVAGNTRLR